MPEHTYRLNFLGDVMLARLIDQMFPTHIHELSEADIAFSFVQSDPKLQTYGPHSPWGDTISLIQESDLNFINLETAVTTHDEKWPDKAFNYRMHPANIDALHAAKIHYAGLANNHTLDFSERGLAETVKTVREAGIAFAGAGDTQDEARRPAILTLPSSDGSRQHKICIWAASDHPSDWQAIPNFHFFDYSPSTKQRLKNLMNDTTPPDASLKIWSCHWGPNYAWHPAQEIRDFAHFMIDECDIDIIHGHSSHHVQGVEVYRGKLIIYGCGDFVDDYRVRSYRNDLSGLWRVVVEEKKGRLEVKRLEMFPTVIEKFQARRLGAEERDARWVRGKVVELSEALGTKCRVEDEGEGRVIVDLT